MSDLERAVEIAAIAHRGQQRHVKTAKVHEASGFNHVVSEADGDHVPVQIEDSNKFLVANRDEIRRLVSFPGVEVVCLDFGWDFPHRSWSQFNFFPVELLRECAALGVAIEVSIYDSESPNEQLQRTPDRNSRVRGRAWSRRD